MEIHRPEVEKKSIYSGSMLKLNDSNDAGNEKLGLFQTSLITPSETLIGVVN